MKFVIVLTAVLALATASTLPYQKFDYQNDLFSEHENANHNSEYVQQQEERDSIATSLNSIVNVIRQNKNDITKPNDFQFTTNEISIPDFVNIGFKADTFFSNIRVNGLMNYDNQNMTMIWGKDLILVNNSWKKFEVYGAFHHINTVARKSGSFSFDIINPKYNGETLLTKNSNVYPLMPRVGSVTFSKVIVNYTSLPEVFQYEKLQIADFVKNVVAQHVATAQANNMYNDFALEIRRTVKSYMVYRSNKIASETAVPVTGYFADGIRFEMKNLNFDNTKNNLAKIVFVQVNKTKDSYTATLKLRLLDVTGQLDVAVTSPNGQTHGQTASYTTEVVHVIADLDFVENKVRTAVYVTKPQIQLTPTGSDTAVNWSDVQTWLAPHFNAYFMSTLEDAVNRDVRQSMI